MLTTCGCYAILLMFGAETAERSTLTGHQARPGAALLLCRGLGAAPPDWQRRGLMPQSARSHYRERRKHLPLPLTSLYWLGPEGAWPRKRPKARTGRLRRPAVGPPWAPQVGAPVAVGHGTQLALAPSGGPLPTACACPRYVMHTRGALPISTTRLRGPRRDAAAPAARSVARGDAR